jgi:RNA 3'-terminal phosphate cyclase
LDKITNGTKVEVNETGTAIYFQPGLLVGGPIEHDCSCQRGIGYYLESVMQLAPFCKKPLKIVLRGVTNDQVTTFFNIIKVQMRTYIAKTELLLRLSLKQRRLCQTLTTRSLHFFFREL